MSAGASEFPSTEALPVRLRLRARRLELASTAYHVTGGVRARRVDEGWMGSLLAFGRNL